MAHHVLTHVVQDTLLRQALSAVQWLDPRTASDIGGRLARLLGPRLPVSRVAEQNLRYVLPELGSAARTAIIRGVWDNLGRTVGEFPHLATLRETASGPGYEIAGALEVLEPNALEGPAIYVSAHYGNWEILPLIASARGAGFAPMYRAAGNTLVDRMIREQREKAVGRHIPIFAKGAAGARAAAAHLARGGRIGLLVDQKLNEGIAVPFLGRPAMTTPFPAVLALRYRCPVIPGRIDRIGPFRFRLTIEPPLPLPDSGDRRADIRALTTALNQVIERWVRARPEAWLWLHRRWPADATARDRETGHGRAAGAPLAQ
jgi:KDO2-lipid IV(A) lauroyltransferase